MSIARHLLGHGLDHIFIWLSFVLPFPHLLHCPVFLPTPAWELFLLGTNVTITGHLSRKMAMIWWRQDKTLTSFVAWNVANDMGYLVVANHEHRHPLRLDHVFIWFGPAPPMPLSLSVLPPGTCMEILPIGNQCDNTWSFKTLSSFGLWKTWHYSDP